MEVWRVTGDWCEKYSC